jgi:hypothetical protein
MPEQPKESKLAYRTCFSSLSYYGHKLDILKSGLQKYLRRREEEKMLWCLGEIYLFKVYANSEQEKRATRGIITNLINRIIVMLDEELLFIEWDKYLIIYNLIEKFEKEERNDFVSLIKICKILCNSRLLRRNSDINAYFNFGMRKADGKKPEILEEREEGEDVDNWHFRNFKAYFEKGDRNCFYWMYKIYIARREGDKRRFKRKENIYMVWEFLLKIGFGNPLLTKCLNYRLKEFFNKSKKERGIFLTSAIDLCLEKNNITWSADALKNEPDVNVEDVRNLFQNRKKLVFDSYVIDMHTSLGRKMGKNAINFMEEGSFVKDEDQEFLEKEWRETYNNGKLESYAKKLAEKKAKAMKKAEKEKMKEAKKVEKTKKAKKKTVKIVKSCEQKEEPKKGKTDREKIRAAKYKRIKKMRGKVNFDDLEKNLKFADGLNIQKEKLILCSDTTCGNKVMCFEYDGKIWKESRKSMFYNRDYCVIDACKELFGLRKIGMERVLSNFRIEKIDKGKKSWKDNWHKVIIGEDEERVVYCVMNKIVNCNWKVPMEIGNIKHSFQNGECRRHLKEFAKIGVFRGIFRCSDFNCRNVLVGCDKSYLADYFVSIDEGDIGKRLDIIGKRESWLIKALNKDTTIINEILNELTHDHTKIIMSLEEMERYKFKRILIDEVENNWKNLKKDLEAEGILFD